MNWLYIAPTLLALWAGSIGSASAARSDDLSAWMQLYDLALTDYHHGNFIRAHDNLLQLADYGSAAAQTVLGYMYLNGEGVKSSAPIAATWFIKAANRGYAPAQVALAHLYENGTGVYQSNAKAIIWYSIVSSRAGGDVARMATKALARLRLLVPVATFAQSQDIAERWRPALPLLPH